MIVSIAEEMNPARRNTMEDVHVAHPPGSWGAPEDGATFLGVYDGHGGRLIADYLEDHLAENVAREWAHAEAERSAEEKEAQGAAGGSRERLAKKRRMDESREKENDDGNAASESLLSGIEAEGRIVQTALERAFLLTDVQSRIDGVTTSGATVVCCVVVPKFSPDGKLESIVIHAANAGDARAVLSSSAARPLRKSLAGGKRGKPTGSGAANHVLANRSRRVPNPELPSELPLRRRSTKALRITHDHKSTDPAEVARIESAGGVMIRGRVLGVLAVARSLGDHGLKEYVIGQPHLSSTTVRIVDDDDDHDDNISFDGGSGEEETTQSARPGCAVKTASAPYTDGEFLIVACDGLWDVMEDQEAVDFVRDRVAKGQSEGEERSREEVSQCLVDEALRRGSTDNITVIVYWL